MGEITIAIEDEVLAHLRMRALARNQSVQDLVREMISNEAPTSAAEKLAAFRRVRAMTPCKLTTSSTDMIRADRDSR